MKESIIVFKHEARYFLTLKQMKKSIFIQCFAPAFFVLINLYFNQVVDLRLAVIIMIIGIPRIPMSLAGYSVSGEKVYKTFESILSTPISIKSLLYGKLILPIFISLLMFTLSTLIVLIAEFLVIKYNYVELDFIFFTLDELIIIFGNGLLVVTFIVFITSLATMMMKVARNGLFVTSIITFLFGIPYSIVLYRSNNRLLFSLILLAILLIINSICYLYLLKKVNVRNLFSRAL